MIKEIIVFIGYRSRVQKREGGFRPVFIQALAHPFRRQSKLAEAGGRARAIPASAKFRGYASIGLGLIRFRAERGGGCQSIVPKPILDRKSWKENPVIESKVNAPEDSK